MRYRKKPVVIEAKVFYGKNGDELVEWMREGGYPAEVRMTHKVAGEPRYSVFLITLEGEMRADAGDYIIKGIAGEFYPCKPDIFHDTYDPVIDF